MTATTSKLGAEMLKDLEEIRRTLKNASCMSDYGDAVEILSDLIDAHARQPAAIDKEADDDIEEAREILENMVRSIELDGNYSTEATCTFLRQALNCLPVAAPLANEASKPAVRNCQTGWADFCLMAKHDGVTCPSESCDIDDGVRAAPLVEQDECGAFEASFKAWVGQSISFDKVTDDEGDERYTDEWLQGAWIGWQARAASTSANVRDERRRFSSADEFDKWAAASEERADQGERAAFVKLMGYDLPTVDGAAKDVWEGQRATWLEALEFAASTSANVAQGAEAVALTEDQRQILEWCKNYHFRRCVEGDFHLRIVAVVNQILDASSSPPALTDDARDAARYRWLRDGEEDVFCVFGSNGTWGECGHIEIYGDRLDEHIDAALTAAQSASEGNHAG